MIDPFLDDIDAFLAAVFHATSCATAVLTLTTQGRDVARLVAQALAAASMLRVS